MSEVLHPDLNMIEGFLASCVPHPLFFLNSLLPWEVQAAADDAHVWNFNTLGS
jgi:hypothetical protein